MTRCDLTGMRFGRLVAISPAPNKDRRTMWLCKCDCGNTCTVRTDYLKNGMTKSCGCYQKDARYTNHLIHGLTDHPIMRTYRHMLSRCYNPNVPNYDRYGGRGITICDEWREDFMSFYTWSILNGWAEGLSIDRIDNDKGYSPENCRWTTMDVQANNKSLNRKITYGGKTLTVSEWAKECNIPYFTLYARFKSGWPAEEALTKPVGPARVYQARRDHSKDCVWGVPINNLESETEERPPTRERDGGIGSTG